MEYISDIKLRETIQSSTCRSEEFNDFIQWVFFFNRDDIQENLRAKQEKMIRYSHLVANQVILYNAFHHISAVEYDGLICSFHPRGYSPFCTKSGSISARNLFEGFYKGAFDGDWLGTVL